MARTCPFAGVAMASTPAQGASSGREALKAEHRTGSVFDPTVVLLDQVVEPLPAPALVEAPQLAIPLHLAQRAGVALEPVGNDGP
jgi:hypothetical protein